jgi:hypothetical protein
MSDNNTHKRHREVEDEEDEKSVSLLDSSYDETQESSETAQRDETPEAITETLAKDETPEDHKETLMEEETQVFSTKEKEEHMVCVMNLIATLTKERESFSQTISKASNMKIEIIKQQDALNARLDNIDASLAVLGSKEQVLTDFIAVLQQCIQLGLDEVHNMRASLDRGQLNLKVHCVEDHAVGHDGVGDISEDEVERPHPKS